MRGDRLHAEAGIMIRLPSTAISETDDSDAANDVDQADAIGTAGVDSRRSTSMPYSSVRSPGRCL